jgi:hypothetical protein
LSSTLGAPTQTPVQTSSQPTTTSGGS